MQRGGEEPDPRQEIGEYIGRRRQCGSLARYLQTGAKPFTRTKICLRLSSRFTELGRDDFAFEAIILRYPEHFSDEAILKAKDKKFLGASAPKRECCRRVRDRRAAPLGMIGQVRAWKAGMQAALSQTLWPFGAFGQVWEPARTATSADSGHCPGAHRASCSRAPG